MKKQKNNLDFAVESAIHDLYPGHYVPDENNYLPDGSNYPAPDHLVCDDQVLIERKSLNSKDDGQLWRKVRSIASEQGKQFMGVGKVNVASIINQLPDPESANRKLADYCMNKVLTNIKLSLPKFKSYEEITKSFDKLAVLIISDQSEITSSTIAVEHYIGRKMGGYSRKEDKAGRLDCIMFIKDPRYTIKGERNHWFKVLIRDELSDARKRTLQDLSLKLHMQLFFHKDYNRAAEQFSGGKFRFVYV